MSQETKIVEISEIRENPIALRQVNRESESYLELVASVKETGILNPILICRVEDKETGENYYKLIDGLHRFSACRDCGVTEVPALIKDMDEAQILEAQLMANIHVVETKPSEYSQQLRMILTHNPLMTESELARRLGKSPAWIGQRLSLNKIDSDEVRELINEGKIGLTNAYVLARLPVDRQADFVQDAMLDPPEEFVPRVQAEIKRIKEERRKGKDSEPSVWEPRAFMRPLKELKEENASPKAAVELTKKYGDGAKEFGEGFQLALQWVLNLDPDSVELQKAKHEQREAEKAEASEKRKAEREAKRAKEAAEAAASIA